MSYTILHLELNRPLAHYYLKEDMMPRTSPYDVRLSLEERLALERRAAQYTAPYRDVVRAKIILMAAEGLQNKEIAARLSLPVQIVTKWRKRFHQNRLNGLREQPRRQPTAPDPS